MTTVEISFLHEHSEQSPSVNPDRYGRFLDEVSHYHGANVPSIEGALQDVARPRGFILFVGSHVEVALNRCEPEVRRRLAARLLPIEVLNRPKIFERVLEPLSLAGAIDSMSLSEWMSTAATKVGARGLYGRKDVRSQIGASCLLFESERYCYFQSGTHQGLPHLVVDYLKALAPLVESA
jgi:hypothetical protein